MKHMDICILLAKAFFFFLFLFFLWLKIKPKPSNETDLDCWSLCKRKIFELFVISFRTLLTELHLRYTMFIYDECINILPFILESFYPNICKYFCRKTLKMWVGYSSDCPCCFFSPLCPCSFSIYSTARLSSSPQQVVFHEGHKDLHPGSFPVKQWWGMESCESAGVKWLTPETEIFIVQLLWPPAHQGEFSTVTAHGSGQSFPKLCPSAPSTKNITRGKKEKLQKSMGLNWVKMVSCSCWSFLLAQETGLATSKPAAHHIKARHWHWAMMWQVQSLLDILPLGKGPDGHELGRLAGLCAEVVLCCVDMISWMRPWFSLSSIPLEFCSHGMLKEWGFQHDLKPP